LGRLARSRPRRRWSTSRWVAIAWRFWSCPRCWRPG
jgi:hypothetical protein